MESELNNQLENAEAYIQQLRMEKENMERQYENEKIESISIMNTITEEKN